jgi:hypothetical protein
MKNRKVLSKSTIVAAAFSTLLIPGRRAFAQFAAEAARSGVLGSSAFKASVVPFSASLSPSMSGPAMFSAPSLVGTPLPVAASLTAEPSIASAAKAAPREMSGRQGASQPGDAGKFSVGEDVITIDGRKGKIVEDLGGGKYVVDTGLESGAGELAYGADLTRDVGQTAPAQVYGFSDGDSFFASNLNEGKIVKIQNNGRVHVEYSSGGDSQGEDWVNASELKNYARRKGFAYGFTVNDDVATADGKAAVLGFFNDGTVVVMFKADNTLGRKFASELTKTQ